MVNHTFRALRAAALVVVLVGAGAVASEADSLYLDCVSGAWSPGQVSPCVGTFSAGVTRSNTWMFYNGPTTDPARTLLYTFQISGTPYVDFSLGALDVTSPVSTIGIVGDVGPGLSLTCVPTLNNNLCRVFDVGVLSGSGNQLWQPGTDGHNYSVKITWFQDNPPLSPNITILKSNDNFLTFAPLDHIWYDPYMLPPDPGIGGRGDTFSTFGVFTFDGPGVPASVVPEPASMLLLGTGLAGLVVRARRRKK